MAHSLGVTGATYASGTRVMPGGSAFTLTGVFIDRITPRLMAVGAMARAQAGQINAMGTKLGRMTAYLDRQKAALAGNREQIKRLALERRALIRSINQTNASISQGTRLATAEEAAHLRALRTKSAANSKEIAELDVKIMKIRQAAVAYEMEGVAAVKAGMGGRTDDLLARAAKDDVKLQTLNLQRQKAVGIQKTLNYEEKKYVAMLEAEGVQLDGATREKLKQILLDKEKLKQKQKQIGLLVAENGELVKGVRTQEVRLLQEKSITEQIKYQASLSGITARGVARKGVMGLAGAGVAAGAISGLSLIPAANTMMGFEQELARIRAIGRFSTSEMWGMGRYTTGMSKQYALSPEQMLGGSLVGVKAGYRDIAELQGMLVPSMQLAIVNGEELDGVMEQLIMTMNAFHIETSRANEVVANQQTLINNSLLQFSDYTDGMKYAAAWANELGLSYEEVGAMIATMTDAGVRAGISGRSLRRMFSKFADDMDVIAQKIQKGGTSLDYFTEDGVLNVRALIESLSEGVDNVEEMQFALDRFGLRGAQSFLLLSQNLDRYDELVAMQTGNTEELAKMAEEAQNTIQGQWQLLKNTLREPLLSEGLVGEMKGLVRYLREEGGIVDLANTFARIVHNAIVWLRSGAFDDLVKLAGNLAKIFADMQPALLGITNLLIKIGKMWYIVLPLARMMKANTLLNLIGKSLYHIAILRGMGGYGPASTFVGRNVFGLAGGDMVKRGAVGAAGAVTRAGVAGAGMAGLGTLSLATGGIALGLLGLYALYKHGQKKQEDLLDEFRSGNTGQTINNNFYGDTFGVDGFENRILDASSMAWSQNRRSW